jgi:L-ascorbate metabolism protein UlaG (beta-lactamase superfamily)
VKPVLRWTVRIAALFGLVAAVAAWRLLDHPSLALHAGEPLPVASDAAQGVRARWLGCATVLLDDGETRLLVDGFFSRPGGLRVLLGRFAPDEARIEAGLARAQLESLTAVMTAHSHYDHAMDAPLVAERTGAVLIGSASTAMIARGLDFPQERMRTVAGGERFAFGAFELTVLRALHTPGRGGAAGAIEQPLRPPARHADYREGGCFSFHVAHPAGNVLVHPSTNFVPGAFAGLRADVLFLGTARLGRLDDAFVRDWWRETALACGAKLVIPIHWDDFTQPLDEPLQPMPALMDDFGLAMRRLRELARESGVRLGRMPDFDPVLVLPADRPR